MSGADERPWAPRQQLEVFFNGWVFLTRLPAPGWVRFNDANLRRSPPYFPLIGALVGAAGAGVYYLTAAVLPGPVAVLAAMLAPVWLTGGFHEDGLADSADAFGGGYDKARILAIMKDSRLGSFGALALFFVLAGKWAALAENVHAPLFGLVLIAGHSLSRLAAVSVLYAGDYVQDPDTAKSRAPAEHLTGAGLLAGAVFGLAAPAALALTGRFEGVVPALAGVVVVSWALARYFNRRIGGYTGDCLGCVQQLTEVTFYTLLLIHL